MPPNNYAPFAYPQENRSGLFRPFTGFENLPSTGFGSLADNIFSMGVQSFGGGMMRQAGMFPLGLGGGGAYDNLRRLQTQQHYDQFVQQAFQADINALTQTFRGVSALAGTPWNEETMRAAHGLANTVAGFGPTAVQMFGANIVDQFAGPSGSSGAMAATMFPGSRLRIDPVTGRPGMSVGSLMTSQREAFSMMYEPGNSGRMQLTAGVGGELYTELARYGMLPGSPGIGNVSHDILRREAETARLITPSTSLDLNKLSPDQLSTLKNTPGVSDALRGFDAARVSSTLEDYSGAIQAMREIFGDAGHPNAPIPELVNALNALTGGSMSQMQPSTLQSMVRTTYNLAQNAGVGVQGLMMLTQTAESHASQFGLPPTMANTLVQESLAFRGAYMHAGMGSRTAWGLGNIDELMMLNQQVTAGNIASPMANRTGLGYRLQQAMEGRDFAAGSDAQLWATASQAGQTEFIDASGRKRSTVMSERQFVDMMASGTGMGADQIYAMLEDEASNMREYRAQGGAALTRNQANAEMRGLLRRELGTSAATAIANSGIAGGDAAALGGILADTAITAYEDVDLRTDDRNRTSSMVSVLKSRVETLAKGSGPEAAAARQLLDRQGSNYGFWAGAAEQLWSTTQRVAESGTFMESTSAQNMLAMMDPELRLQAEVELSRERSNTLLEEAMAPASRGYGFIQRGIGALQNANSETKLTDVFLEAVGGTRAGALHSMLNAGDGEGVLNDVKTWHAEFIKAQQEFETATNSGDAATKTQAWKTLQAKKTGLEQSMQKIVGLFEEQGYSVAENISAEDIVTMRRRRAWVTERITKRQTSDENFKLGVTVERQNADELATSLLSEPELMTRLGATGLRNLGKIHNANEQLDKLAVRYAGGSLTDLLAGKLDDTTSTDAERTTAMEKVKELRNQQDDAYKYFEENVEVVDNNKALSEVAKKLGAGANLRSMSATAFESLRKDDAWGRLSRGEKNTVLTARTEYEKNKEEYQKYVRDYRANPEASIEASLEKLTGRDDLDRDAVVKLVGGEENLTTLTSDSSDTGRRRRAGFSAIADDIARQRVLEAKVDKSDAENTELNSIKKRTESYGAFFEIGKTAVADDPLDPAESFMNNYNAIPSIGPPNIATDGANKEQAVTFYIETLALNGSELADVEGSTSATTATTEPAAPPP